MFLLNMRQFKNQEVDRSTILFYQNIKYPYQLNSGVDFNQCIVHIAGKVGESLLLEGGLLEKVLELHFHLRCAKGISTI